MGVMLYPLVAAVVCGWLRESPGGMAAIMGQPSEDRGAYLRPFLPQVDVQWQQACSPQEVLHTPHSLRPLGSAF